MQEKLISRVLGPGVRVYYLRKGWFVWLVHRDRNNDNDAFDNCSAAKYHDPMQGCAQQLNSAAHHLLAALQAMRLQTSKNIRAKNTVMPPAHRQDVPNLECLLGFFQRFALS